MKYLSLLMLFVVCGASACKSSLSELDTEVVNASPAMDASTDEPSGSEQPDAGSPTLVDAGL